MSKPTQATIFRKRQVLPARALNKALQEYGSTGGTIPYKTDGTQDESMTAALGTKTAPFGNAFFKGFNIYTEIEVQSLVSSGKITSDDRFVFWDLSSNSLKAWDGSKIIQIGGNGGNMDYLFGNGSDGDVTMVSSGNYDTVKNFKNFTLNAGVTLSQTNAGHIMVIRCTGKFTWNGNINLDGKGWPAGQGYGTGAKYQIYGSSSTSQLGHMFYESANIAGITSINKGGNAAKVVGLSNFAGGNGASGGGAGGQYSASEGAGTAGGNFDEVTHRFLAQNLQFDQIAMMGGGGGNSPSGVGGTGGGGLLVVCREFHFTGSFSAKGLQGTSYAGGGGGGSATIVCNEVSINSGSYDCSGGALNTGGSSKPGGRGGFVIIKI